MASALTVDQRHPATWASQSLAGSPSRHEIEQRIIAGVAQVLAADLSEIEQRVYDGGGDMEIDSKAGEAVIAKLEREFGQKLPGPADLKRDQFTSIRALADLVERKLRIAS